MDQAAECKEKIVRDEFNQMMHVDASRITLRSYSNKENWIFYCAPQSRPQASFSCMVCWYEPGQIESLEERLQAQENNPVKEIYERLAGLQRQNDPQGLFWNEIKNFVQDNEELFFTKEKDWRKHQRISTSLLQEKLLQLKNAPNHHEQHIKKDQLVN
jgi:hypothetical protein